MVSTSTSDEEIAALVQRGDFEQFGILMQRYEPKLRRYGSKFLARTDDIQDIVQDVFVQTYQNIKNFDTKQRFSPWIYRIAHNAFANELRRKSRHPLLLPDFDMLLEHLPASESADETSEQRVLKEMVEAGLAGLPASFREILVLYFVEELSYKEIADVLHIPVNIVGVRLSRAKRALRKTYEARNMTYDQ